MAKIAVIDDWQGIAAQSADWETLRGRAEIVFIQEAFVDEDDAAAKLHSYEIVMAMRERTAFPASLVKRLPKLLMFSMTGPRAASSDTAFMKTQGITVTNTEGGGTGTATPELALALMLASARNIPQADATIRRGGFQNGVAPGYEVYGKTLGLVGLGRLGQKMAAYGFALGMEVIAWSPNLTAERAAAQKVSYVTKELLLERSDVISLHLVLSSRTQGIIGAADIARMKPGALLINTSRGPLIDEAAMVDALYAGRISGALDVYDREPLPPGHRLRTAPNTVLTPHLGYGSVATFQAFYRQSIENVLAFLDSAPIRLMPD